MTNVEVCIKFNVPTGVDARTLREDFNNSLLEFFHFLHEQDCLSNLADGDTELVSVRRLGSNVIEGEPEKVVRGGDVIVNPNGHTMRCMKVNCHENKN